MKRLFGIYLRYHIMSAKRISLYKLSTLLHFSQFFIWVAVDLIFFKSIFNNTGSFAGWSYWDAVLLVLTLSLFWDIFWRGTSGGVAYIPDRIFNGEINSYLLKPINPLFSLSISGIGILENSFNTPILLIYYILNQGFPFSFTQVIAYLLTLLLGVGIFTWMLIIIVSLTFWVRDVSYLEQVYWELQHLARYPKDIFTGFLSNLFMFVIPVFFIANIPIDALRHGVRIDYILLGILLNVVLGGTAIFIWEKGLTVFDSSSV